VVVDEMPVGIGEPKVGESFTDFGPGGVTFGQTRPARMSERGRGVESMLITLDGHYSSLFLVFLAGELNAVHHDAVLTLAITTLPFIFQKLFLVLPGRLGGLAGPRLFPGSDPDRIGPEAALNPTRTGPGNKGLRDAPGPRGGPRFPLLLTEPDRR
jgi:hypothetical protein